MERTTHCPAKRQTPPKDWTKSPNNCPQKMWKQNMHNPRQKQQLLQKNMTTLKYPPVNYHNYNNGKSTMFQKEKYIFRRSICIAKFVYQRGKSIRFFRQGQPGALNSPYGHLKLDGSIGSQQLFQTIGTNSGQSKGVFFWNLYQSYMNVAVKGTESLYCS